MIFQLSALCIVCLGTQKIEQLGIHDRNQKIEGCIGI